MTDCPRAYAACEALARSHYENFPVASRLLPAAMRPHIAAVYAFARVADDMADEGALPSEARRARLAAWQRRLHAALGVERAAEPQHDHEDLIIVATAHTIRSLDLPVALFDDLISAFGQDTMTSRYASWPDLFDYCRRSANPVGRLVLRIAGARDGALDAASDAVCTALQLTNFWQDLKIDFERGRIYLPADERTRHGAREDDLRGDSLTPEWRRALAAAVSRTRELFDAGRPICDGIGGRLGWELRATWLGGIRILDKLERAGFD